MKSKLKRILKKVPKAARRGFRINSIQSIITLSFSAVTMLAMTMVGIGLYSSFSDNAEVNAASSAQQIMEQATINLENYLEDMMEISDIIRKNMREVTPNSIQNLDNLLSLTLEMRKDIVTVAIYTGNGNVILTNPVYDTDYNYQIHEQEWFKQTISNPDMYLIQPPYVQRLFEGRRPWVVSMSSGLSVEYLGRTETWAAMVDLNFSLIEQLCNRVSLGKRGYIYIVDEYGNIIYHPQQQLLYSGLKQESISEVLEQEQGSFIEDFQGESRISTVKNIQFSNWKMVGISYVDELAENQWDLNNYIMYILIFGIVFVILASIFLSSKISKPIKRLEHQMNRVEQGDFDIENLEVKGEDEVKRLTKAFNLMISRIKQLMEQIVNEQEEKRKSEFKALQAQINPHFLYNTLDSIIWMNENQNHQGVSEMTAALAKFFRISISKGNEIIDVADEIEHVGNYLLIQKIRYKNKFDYSIDVQEQAYGYRTLKLILQPIVENAIYHGINKIQEKGEINIRAVVENDHLLFSVTDNGYGIKPERLKEIFKREPTNKRTSGVGLKNVHERIQLSYGSGFGVDIESIIEVGTTVNIRIPLIKLQKGENNE
ncbi:MAG: sensor histidine kinase [Clostridiales bacterium]|nr:sensor histidine kinase [Clostridiales bacterium]